VGRFEDGCYGSLKGIALIGKVMAGRCKMHYTRVAAGKGAIPEGASPKTLDEPPEYVMDAMISAVTNPVDGECQVSVQINSADVETGFYVTGLLLYAEDPDEGEVPFTYLVLEGEPEWIRPSSSIVGKLAHFDLIAAVGDVDSVTATIDPSALVTRDSVLRMFAEHNRSIMMGEVTLPLATAGGDALLASDGTPIDAVYKIASTGNIMAAVAEQISAAKRETISAAAADAANRASAAKREAVSTAASDAAAKVSAVRSDLTAEISAQIAAHNTVSTAHPMHLAVVTKS